MDAFTKWAEAFPLCSKEAEPIARILVEQLFTRFGPPLSLLSDMGREVDGRIMREVCQLFGVESCAQRHINLVPTRLNVSIAQ